MPCNLQALTARKWAFAQACNVRTTKAVHGKCPKTLLCNFGSCMDLSRRTPIASLGFVAIYSFKRNMRTQTHGNNMKFNCMVATRLSPHFRPWMGWINGDHLPQIKLKKERRRPLPAHGHISTFKWILNRTVAEKNVEVKGLHLIMLCEWSIFNYQRMMHSQVVQ